MAKSPKVEKTPPQRGENQSTDSQAGVNNMMEWKQALTHEDEWVRFGAAFRLARAGEVTAIPVLVEALRHDSWAVRHHHAIRGLVKVGETAAPVLLEVLAQQGRRRPCAAQALYQISTSHLNPVLPALMEALRDVDEQARSGAAWVLQEIGRAAETAAPALRDVLAAENETAQVRVFAARALAKMEALTAEAIPALLQILRDEQDWTSRCHGAKVLADMGETAQQAVPFLINLLNAPENPVDVRVDAARVLGGIGKPAEDIVPALMKAFEDTDWWVRLYAGRALGALGAAAKAAIPRLLTAWKTADGDIRRNAGYALAQMGEAAQETIPFFIQVLGDAEVGALAADVLAKIGQPAIPVLLNALNEEAENAACKAAYALKRGENPEAVKAVEVWERERGLKPFEPKIAHLYLPAPEITLDDAKCAEFEALFQATLGRGPGSTVVYTSRHPKYEFLYYAVQRKGALLHGTSHRELPLLKPIRWSMEGEGESFEAGNVSGVYAAPDEILPIYFAILDRQNHKIWLTNGDVGGKDAHGASRKFYHFSINAEMLRKRPYVEGAVYILPRETFEEDRAGWYSRYPVRPLMWLSVSPADFPFLEQMRGFDSRDWGWVLPEGLPFLKAVQWYPVWPSTRTAGDVKTGQTI